MIGKELMKYFWEVVHEITYVTQVSETLAVKALFEPHFFYERAEMNFNKVNYLKLAAYYATLSDQLPEGIEYSVDLTEEEAEIMSTDFFKDEVYPKILNLVIRGGMDDIIYKLKKVHDEDMETLRLYGDTLHMIHKELVSGDLDTIRKTCLFMDQVIRLDKTFQGVIGAEDAWSRYVGTVVVDRGTTLFRDILKKDFKTIKNAIVTLQTYYQSFISIMRDKSPDAMYEFIAQVYDRDALAVRRSSLVRNIQGIRKLTKMLGHEEKWDLVADKIVANNPGESLLEILHSNSMLIGCKRYVFEHTADAIHHVASIMELKRFNIDEFVVSRKMYLEKVGMEYSLFKDIFEHMYHLNESTGTYELTEECSNLNIYPEVKSKFITLYELNNLDAILTSENIFTSFNDEFYGEVLKLNDEFKHLITE